MHAYCRISSVGSSRKSRARVCREMKQSPTLKTRRSNAVQTRRLALHVSLLERHLAALEAERERDVRVVQKELNHLRYGGVSRMRSPHPDASLGGSGEKDAFKERPKPLSVLERSSADDNCTGIPRQHKQPPVTCEGLPPIRVHQDVVSSDEGNECVTHRSNEGVDSQSDASQQLDNCFRRSLPGSRRTTSGRKGRVYLSTTGRGKFLPPMGHDHDPSQHTLMQSRIDSEKGRRSEGNVPDTQQGDTSDVARSFEELGESKSAGTDTTGTREQPICPRPSKSPEHRSDLNIQTETKRHPLPRKPKALSEPPRRRRTPSALTLRSADVIHKRCHLAGSHNDTCGYFPCTQPPTYHSLGFHPDHTTHTWRHWVYQNACRPHHRLVPGRPIPALKLAPEETEDPRRKRRRRLGKEEVIRMDMARKKHLHALARPPSWNTNYGQPTSYKRLKNPVRLKPLSVQIP